MKKHIVRILAVAICSFSCTAFSAAVDTDGNAVTNQTLLGNIDMGKSTVGDLSACMTNDFLRLVLPYADLVASSATTYTDMVALERPTWAEATNVVRDIITNTSIVGYSDWNYSGDVVPGVTYSITFEPSGGQFVFTLWNATTAANLGNVVTNILNPTRLDFSIVTGNILATRNAIVRNSEGLALFSDVKQLEDKIDSMDTSYLRTVGLTNKNQSIQYVYTAEGVTSLQIQMPISGMTKDWVVYVLATTNLTLELPPANYWVLNESVTNDISAATPTALYFSQINDDTYSIARQELIPITVESQRTIQMREFMKRARSKAKFSR